MCEKFPIPLFTLIVLSKKKIRPNEEAIDLSQFKVHYNLAQISFGNRLIPELKGKKNY